MKVRYVNLSCYYILPLIAFLTYLFLLFFYSENAYGFSLLMGDFTWYLLLIIVFMKPLKKVFPTMTFINKIYYRKQLGVLTTYLFFIHGVGALLHLELYSISDYSGWSNYLLWGLVAGVLMTLLGATSNVYSTKKLNSIVKRGWKKFQRLTYLLVIFAMLHVYLVSGNVVYLMVVGVYLLLKILEFSKVVYK